MMDTRPMDDVDRALATRTMTTDGRIKLTYPRFDLDQGIVVYHDHILSEEETRQELIYQAQQGASLQAALKKQVISRNTALKKLKHNPRYSRPIEFYNRRYPEHLPIKHIAILTGVTVFRVNEWLRDGQLKDRHPLTVRKFIHSRMLKPWRYPEEYEKEYEGWAEENRRYKVERMKAGRVNTSVEEVEKEGKECDNEIK